MAAKVELTFWQKVGQLFGRSIDAAGAGKGWSSTPIARPSREIAARRAAAERRSNAQVINNPLATAIVLAYENIVGDGPAVRPDRPELQPIADELYENGDFEGITNLGAALRRIMAGLAISGEVFIQLLTDRRTGRARYKILASEQLDGSIIRPKFDGGWIENGIEYNADGQRIAYYFRRTVRGGLALAWDTIRVDAADILHLFEPRFPGQQRGISWLSSSATRIEEISRLGDAALAKYNAEALIGIIFTNPDASHVSDLEDKTTGDYSMEPGSSIFAPPGYQATTVNPSSSTGINDVLKTQIRAASSGAGVPYELSSGDLSEVNYSSARVGLLEFRRRAVSIQRNILVARFLRPLWKRTLMMEHLAGRLSDEIAVSSEAEFSFPGWDQLDPFKETKADVEAINAKLKSRHEVIAARGRDPHVVDAEITKDKMGAVA
jgi:lambda family phage portal protein